MKPVIPIWDVPRLHPGPLLHPVHGEQEDLVRACDAPAGFHYELRQLTLGEQLVQGRRDGRREALEGQA